MCQGSEKGRYKSRSQSLSSENTQSTWNSKPIM